MKKLLALFLIAGLCSGCVYDLPKEQKPQNVQEQEQKPQEQQKQVQKQKPQEQQKQVQEQQKPVQEPQQVPPADNKQQKLDRSSFIGDEKAREIALSYAGVSASEVIFEKTELDNDDGVWEYEIEFRKGAVEYDVEVRADNGKVIRYDKDIDD